MSRSYALNIECKVHSDRDTSDKRAESLNHILFDIGMHEGELCYIPAGEDGKHTPLSEKRSTKESFYKITIPSKRFIKLLAAADEQVIADLKNALSDNEAHIFERLTDGSFSTTYTYVAELSPDNFIAHVERKEMVPFERESWCHVMAGCIVPIVIVSAVAGLVAPIAKNVIKHNEEQARKDAILRIIEERNPYADKAGKIKTEKEKDTALER